MEDKDKIKELFSEKLGNYEAKVNPDLWANIASQVGTAATSTAASTGISVFSKWLIGVGISSAVVTTTLIAVNWETEHTSETTPVVAEQSTTKQAPEESVELIEDELPTITERERVLEQPVRSEEGETRFEEMTPPSIGEEEMEMNRSIPTLIDPSDNLIVDTDVIPVEVDDTEQITPTIITGGLPDAIQHIEEPVSEPAVEEPIIEEEDPIVVEEYSIEKLPNTFTPNGDGSNDFFEMNIKGLNDFSIVVMNSQSKTVYSATDSNFKWDGRDIHGMPVPDGEYVYFLTGKTADGTFVKEYSRLTITR